MLTPNRSALRSILIGIGSLMDITGQATYDRIRREMPARPHRAPAGGFPGVEVHPYGDAVLVDLPLTYSDGDTVTVLVERAGDGYRVSDRAEAHMRLSMADVDGPGELVASGGADDLGPLVIAVGRASQKAEMACGRHPKR